MQRSRDCRADEPAGNAPAGIEISGSRQGPSRTTSLAGISGRSFSGSIVIAGMPIVSRSCDHCPRMDHASKPTPDDENNPDKAGRHGDGDGHGNPDDANADSAQLGWGQAVFLMTSDTIGLGLLLLPFAYAPLGYIWGTVVTVIFVMASSYNLYIMSIVKNHICPAARSLRDAALEVGGPRAAAVVGSIVEANWVLGLMFLLSAALTAVTNINQIVVHLYLPEGKELPSYLWTILLGVFLLPMAQIKSLSGASWFGLASTAALVSAIGTAYFCFADGAIAEGAPQEPAAFPVLEQLNAGVGLVLVMQIIFVLVDTSLEVMSDMKDVSQFNSAQIASHVIAGIMCLAVSAGALYFVGPDDIQPYILASIHPSWQSILAEAAVAFKGAVTYTIVVIIMLSGWYGKARSWARNLVDADVTSETGLAVMDAMDSRNNSCADSMDIKDSCLMAPVSEETSCSESSSESCNAAIIDTVSDEDEFKDINLNFASEVDEQMCTDLHKVIDMPVDHKSSSNGLNKQPAGDGLRIRIARFVDEDKHLSVIWLMTSICLITFTAVIVGTFPYIDLIGSFLSALTGAPLVFGMPYYLLIWGSKKTGHSLSTLDGILSRAFLYVFMPALLVVGTIVTIMDTLERFKVITM